MSSAFQNGKDVVLDNRTSVEILENEVVLSCRSSVKADQGKYSVTLKNEKGTDTATVNVIVLSKYISI